MDDLACFCCQHPDCTLYGRRDAGNLSVCGRLGKHKQFRQLYRNACRARSSERKGTALYLSLPPARGDGRLGKDTVTRLALLAGRPAKDAHDELVPLSPRDPRGPAR